MADNVDDANNGNNHLQTVMAACQVIIAVAVIVAGGYSIKIDCETERHFDFDKFLFMDLPLLHFTALKLESILECSSCADEYYYVSARQIFLGQLSLMNILFPLFPLQSSVTDGHFIRISCM